MKIEKCVLTGYDLINCYNDSLNPLIVKYESEYSGLVQIAMPTYMILSQKDEPNWKLAGINLHNTIEQKKSVLINSEFLINGHKKYAVPKEFEEKCYMTLKGLYLLIGKENKSIDQGIGKLSALGFTNYEEFMRILDQLISERLLACRNKQSLSRNRYLYIGISVTNTGKEKAKEMLPKIPMINLVDGSISTGFPEIDIKVNNAKDMFFKEPRSMENMRSACEQLSFVLEPFRSNLQNYFSSKDVADFFQIVNNFDVRHNKDSTKNMQYPEQLEWVFYTLLNSISTYYKLEKRMNTGI